jgi:hypothetical protein
MLVFVDESSVNKRTSDRKYGWSPRGWIKQNYCLAALFYNFRGF